MTELQRKYARAMTDLKGPLRSTKGIADTLGVASSQVAPTRAQLIKLGMIYSPMHGFNAFTVPQFDEFMRRQMPLERHIPARRQR